MPVLDLIRTPFEAQQHVIEAARQALRRQKSILLVGEMGTGKTIMGMSRFMPMRVVGLIELGLLSRPTDQQVAT